MRKADVWSLGCVLFALTTGFFAFDRAHPDDVRFRLAMQMQPGDQPNDQHLSTFKNTQGNIPSQTLESFKLLILLRILEGRHVTFITLSLPYCLSQLFAPCAEVMTGKQLCFKQKF